MVVVGDVERKRKRKNGEEEEEKVQKCHDVPDAMDAIPAADLSLGTPTCPYNTKHFTTQWKLQVPHTSSSIPVYQVYTLVPYHTIPYHTTPSWGDPPTHLHVATYHSPTHSPPR